MKRMLGAVVMAIAWVLPGYCAAVLFKTTDQSDLWWIPSESGWGIQIVQEESTIFATMFVYGPNRQPTWYVALLNDPTYGDFTWTGTLYATTGPWFGAVPFDPTATTATPVGMMTFQAQNINAATLTYTVNGVQIVKQIQRETLATIDFSGSYSGVLSQAAYGGSCAPAVITDATPATFRITQNGASIRIDSSSQVGTCTLDGNFTQQGHMGEVTGNYSCIGGDSGTFAMSEMTASWFEFHARIGTASQSGCTLKGFASGLRQPPPAQ
jgi:hypothetical protein